MAKSLYRQYLTVGGTERINDFYGLSSSTQPILSLDRFRFRAYVEKTISMFPAGVLVLTFEEFLESRHVFLDRLSEFLGTNIPDIDITPSNATRLGSMGLEISRVLNRFFRNKLNPKRVSTETDAVYSEPLACQRQNKPWEPHSGSGRRTFQPRSG